MIFILILFASFVINEKAFGFAEFPPKQQTQLVGSFALAGFVGIYGTIIYLRKSEYFHFSNWNVKNLKDLSHPRIES